MDKTLTKNRPRREPSIQTQLDLLWSLAISLVGKDTEGDYRPEFVEKLIKSLKESPRHRFTSPTNFLKQLKAV